MKRFLLTLAFCALSISVWAAAVQVDFLLGTFLDNDQQPLALGKIYSYAAGTTTPKDLYLDAAKTSTAANPFILTAYGRGNVYADGAYKFVIKTAADVTIATYDNLEFYSAVASTTFLCTNLVAASATFNLVYIQAGTVANATMSNCNITNSYLSNCNLLASPTLDSQLVDLGTVKALIASWHP